MKRYVGAMNKAFYKYLHQSLKYDTDTKASIIFDYLCSSTKDKTDSLVGSNGAFSILLSYNIFGNELHSYIMRNIFIKPDNPSDFVKISRDDVYEYVKKYNCPVLDDITFEDFLLHKYTGKPIWKRPRVQELHELITGMRYRDDVKVPSKGKILPSDKILESWQNVESFLNYCRRLDWMINWMYSYLIDTKNPTDVSTLLTTNTDLHIKNEEGKIILATKEQRDLYNNLLRAYNFDADNCKGAYEKYRKVYTPTKEDLEDFILKEPYGYRGTGYTFDDYLDYKLGIADWKVGYRIEKGALEGYFCYPDKKITKRKISSESFGEQPDLSILARNEFWEQKTTYYDGCICNALSYHREPQFVATNDTARALFRDIDQNSSDPLEIIWNRSYCGLGSNDEVTAIKYAIEHNFNGVEGVRKRISGFTEKGKALYTRILQEEVLGEEYIKPRSESVDSLWDGVLEAQEYGEPTADSKEADIDPNATDELEVLWNSGYLMGENIVRAAIRTSIGVYGVKKTRRDISNFTPKGQKLYTELMNDTYEKMRNERTSRTVSDSDPF